MSLLTEATIDWSKADLWGPPRPVRPLGVRDLLVGVGLILLAQLLATGVGLWQVRTGAASTVADVTTDPVVLVSGLVLLWAAFIGSPALTARRLREPMLKVIAFGKASAKAVLWGVGIGLALRAGSIGVGILAEKSGMAVGENSSWLTSVDSTAVLVLLVVGAAFIGPVMEELFFRGLALRAVLASRLVPAQARTLLAVVLSSALFGVSHFTSADAAGLFVIVQTGLLGALFAVLALRDGLTKPIAAHVAFNTSGVILLLLGVA